jgi:hypothetical protein
VEPPDERLIENLRRLARRADPVPERMLRAARSSYAWRTIDSELAELAYDSASHERPLAGVRGLGTPRILSFSALACGLTIEIEATSAAESLDIAGQLVPATHAILEIRHGGGVELVEADELGRFAAENLQAGPFSIRYIRDAANGPAVITEWTTI